ncbi:alkaline phosphatase family protein [Terriglobus saanensis]|uniref:Type I phosphodiesterase/nucleotide pyrophosphatase n=1 Tax=Terriglobus saanensis (strain ATCC BAA-1853 / DSM 23119 / SP1PR4) TaxID=401053 RepID=E8UX69_TERSS|nr:alkaline phosphatase family protein [Terriglobus saanensis]ADV83032.1 type I phosphodiesterase/nucleotide pyrophosphatase [Terriglobus saanensis SP1PR4]
MKRPNVVLLFATLLPHVSTFAAPPTAAPVHKPKLILAIAVDQFRYDYTTRFRGRYTSGLATMLSEGAVFIDAHQDHFPTVTATGHATFLTGSVPATSGIIGNEWYDRKLGKTITSVEDAATTLIGVDGQKVGSSPHNLIVSTLGDEIKMSHSGKSKVIGISMKDRAAILPSGRMADAAYWFDNESGVVISSTWYQQQLPTWVREFNAGKPAFQHLGSSWYALGQEKSGKPLMTLPSEPGKAYLSQWEETPYANDMLEEFAERVMHNEHLGQQDGTDVLTVSFSANDHLGHAVGPDAPEVEDMSVRTDLVIGKLLAAAIKQAGGRENLLVVLTADHGVAPVPEVNQQRKMPGGRLDKADYLAKVEAALEEKFGVGKWMIGTQESGFYLNDDLIEKKKLKHSAVEDEAATAAMKMPFVARTYTRTQLLPRDAMQSRIDDYVARSFFPERGPDVIVIIKPYYLFGKSGTSHGSPYDYDSHVPLIFWGGGVHAGTYTERVGISDVAPTLAAVLEVETPSGSVGHILNEVVDSFLKQQHRSISSSHRSKQQARLQ